MHRTFTLVEVTTGTSLVIGASGRGARQRVGHAIEPLPSGGSRVSIDATMNGPLVPILSRVFGKIIAGYYPTAVKQLARTAEAAAE